MSVSTETVEEFKERLQKLKHRVTNFWEYEKKGPGGRQSNRTYLTQRRGKAIGLLKRRKPGFNSRNFF